MAKKLIVSVFLTLFVAGAMAQGVSYITTQQFKEKIFDYANEKDWKYLGTTPCVVDFYTTWPRAMTEPRMQSDFTCGFMLSLLFYLAIWAHF